MDQQELEDRFIAKPFGGHVLELYERLRDEALMFAHTVNNSMPDSREKSLALTAIEEAAMWANKGLAKRVK